MSTIARGETRWDDTPTARLAGGVEWGSCTPRGGRRQEEAGHSAMVLNLLLLGLVWLVGLTAVHCVMPEPLRRCSHAVGVAAVATARLRREHHGGAAAEHRTDLARRSYRSATLVDVP